MIIGIDAGCLGIRDKRLEVGVYNVVKNLLIQLSSLDKKNKYLLYSFYPIEESLMQGFGKNMQNIVLSSFGWLKLVLPLRLAFDRPEIFLALNQAMPAKLFFQNYKTVGIFYDIAFEKYPEYYPGTSEKHKRDSRNLARNANFLVSISKSTKIDLEKYYKVSSNKIMVAYPGINSKYRFQNVNLPIVKKPYFLFVGAFKRSKNIPILLKAYEKFNLENKNYKLVLAGGDKWLDPEIKKTLKNLDQKVKQNIINLGFVDEKILMYLYKNAFAFVSPSLYEGFGLTFLEAQSARIPVIGSNKGSLPEILGKSALLVEPFDQNQLLQVMKRLVENKKLRQKLIKAGYINSRKYSWKLFAKTVQSAIGYVAKKR